MKQLKINYEKRLQHLELQHDTVISELHNSLKQTENDIVALMTNAEEYKAKRQKYSALSDLLVQNINQLAIFRGINAFLSSNDSQDLDYSRQYQSVTLVPFCQPPMTLLQHLVYYIQL